MIAKGITVQIRRCGTVVPVERLGIGDLVYDPIADNYIEIVDVLCSDTQLIGHQLTKVEAGSLGKDYPSRDVILSRQQPVYYTDTTTYPNCVSLELTAAHEVGRDYYLQTSLYLLFLEQEGSVCAGGMLLKLHDLSILSSPGASR